MTLQRFLFLLLSKVIFLLQLTREILGTIRKNNPYKIYTFKGQSAQLIYL